MNSWKLLKNFSCVYRPVTSSFVFELRPKLIVSNRVERIEIQRIASFRTPPESSKQGIRKFFKKSPEDIEKRIEAQRQEKIPEGLIGKFKYYLHRYWHVAIVVHFGLYACWFAGFYVAVKLGVDVVKILESCNVPETWINKIKKVSPEWSNLAIAFILCKLIAPIRYFVSIVAIQSVVSLGRRQGWLKTAIESHCHVRKIYRTGTEKLQAKSTSLKEKTERFRRDNTYLFKRHNRSIKQGEKRRPSSSRD